MSGPLTHEQAVMFFKYDPVTGYLYWRVNVGVKIKAGQRAGHINKRGYACVRVNGKEYRAHRVIWLMCYGFWPNQIDHINHARSDNRLENLRSVDVTANNRNAGPRRDNTSRVTGVHWCAADQKWVATIAGKYIMSSDDWFNAACARKAAEAEHGFHPNHGRSMSGGH